MKFNSFFLPSIFILLTSSLFISCDAGSIDEELNALEGENFTKTYTIDKEDYEVPPNG